ncbi:MAG TPA: ABC transporter ATP-binding protein, partial [Ferruginibacter sp.]|nr:ABC transporter ATP-binding protein [Ferruginibacter sp.]
GTYAEWEAWKARREAEKTKEPKVNKQAEPVTPVEKKQAEPEKASQPQPVKNNVIDKELKKELQKQKNQFNQLEEKMAQLNSEKTKLEAELASPEVYNDKNRFLQTEARYKDTQAELAKASAAYETAFEKLMELEEKMK